MQKVLYLSNITWNWIKQRPQFLAEKLSEDFAVDYYYRQPIRRKWKKLPQNTVADNSNLNIFSFHYFPYQILPVLKKLPLDGINRLLALFSIRDLDDYDIIWFSSPNLYPLLKKRIKNNQCVVYDCMDDHLAFPNANTKTVKRDELELIRRANKVLFSAEYLKDKVLDRYRIQNNQCIVVNNATSIDNNATKRDIPEDVIRIIEKIKEISNPLIYIGTISEWFDFDLMIKVLENNPEYNLVLIGPESSIVPTHPQIHCLGSVKHEYIFNIMPLAYALVMPFKVIELIKSVNPVKLYEYIFTGRPVIASRYGETEQFKDFVYLYNNEMDFSTVLKTIKNTTIPEAYKDKCKLFVSNNTWDNRYEQIKRYLDE